VIAVVVRVKVTEVAWQPKASVERIEKVEVHPVVAGGALREQVPPDRGRAAEAVLGAVGAASEAENAVC
jgi:hypothetical protein